MCLCVCVWIQPSNRGEWQNPESTRDGGRRAAKWSLCQRRSEYPSWESTVCVYVWLCICMCVSVWVCEPISRQREVKGCRGWNKPRPMGVFCSSWQSWPQTSPIGPGSGHVTPCVLFLFFFLMEKSNQEVPRWSHDLVLWFVCLYVCFSGLFWCFSPVLAAYSCCVTRQLVIRGRSQWHHTKVIRGGVNLFLCKAHPPGFCDVDICKFNKTLSTKIHGSVAPTVCDVSTLFPGWHSSSLYLPTKISAKNKIKKQHPGVLHASGVKIIIWITFLHRKT